MSAKVLFIVVLVLVLATQAASAFATTARAEEPRPVEANSWSAPDDGPFVFRPVGPELDGEFECGGNGTCPT